MGGQFGDQLAAGFQAFQQSFQQQRGTSTLPVQQNPAVQRVQQAIQQRVEAPIPQDIQFPTQAVGVPERTAAPAAPGPTQQAAVPAVVPRQPAQAVVDLPTERGPTEEERRQRIGDLSALEAGTLFALSDESINKDAAQAQTNDLKIKHEEAKLTAKTAQQEVFNQQFLSMISGGDQNQIAQGKPGLQVRSSTMNSGTGNVSITLGLPSTEEQKQQWRQEAISTIMDDIRTGNRKPWQTRIALQMRPDPVNLSSSEWDQAMESIAGQLIAAQIDQGVEMGVATKNAFIETGVIPEAFRGFLPANILNEADITHAKEVAKFQAQLSDPAEQVRIVNRANKAQEQITQSIIDFRSVEKPTGEQTKTRTAHLNAASALDSLVTHFDKAFVGPIRGRVGSNVLDVFGGLKGGEQILRTQIAKLKVNTIQAITGAAMGETEAVRIMATIPDISDTSGVFIQKLRQNAEERMDLLRIHEAVVAQGGRRFRGELSTKEILIGDTMVTVIDVDPSLRIVDPSVSMNFNTAGEAAAGIVATRDGSVIKFNPDTGETTNVDTTGSATAPAQQTPSQAAATAAPTGTTGEISAKGAEIMRRINERLKARGRK